jgi:hypothetical protein
MIDSGIGKARGHEGFRLIETHCRRFYFSIVIEPCQEAGMIFMWEIFYPKNYCAV